MARISAGLLIYKIDHGSIYFLLGHPGGPYFKNKDDGHWTIPKGEVEIKEDLLTAAKREFLEETGITIKGTPQPLKPVKQAGGKIVHAWAIEQAIPENFIFRSNLFEMEWPPKSGKFEIFPELDKLTYFELDIALVKINLAQRQFLLEIKSWFI